jgi:hypothetical protein
MQALVLLIQQPSIDFAKLLATSHDMFGYSISAASDASHKRLSDSERFLSCLSAMKNQNAPVGLPPHLLSHVSFSILIATDDRDLMDILECCSSMTFTTADTVVRGVQAAVVTGTLLQWKTAVLSGCHEITEPSVRFLFNKILAQFEAANLGVWSDCTRKTHREDNTLLLKGPE